MGKTHENPGFELKVAVVFAAPSGICKDALVLCHLTAEGPIRSCFNEIQLEVHEPLLPTYSPGVHDKQAVCLLKFILHPPLKAIWIETEAAR